jgi:hypothetical protein
MSLKVIGAGVGRTGTYSLRLAINHLGLGPCHHMEEGDAERQVPLWEAARKADWRAIYDGYEARSTGLPQGSIASWRPLFLRQVRPDDSQSESWAGSFSETIYKVIATRTRRLHYAGVARDVRCGHAKTGFPRPDDTALMKAFLAHQRAVQAAIPADRLPFTRRRKAGARFVLSWACRFLPLHSPYQ